MVWLPGGLEGVGGVRRTGRLLGGGSIVVRVGLKLELMIARSSHERQVESRLMVGYATSSALVFDVQVQRYVQEQVEHIE